MDSLAVADKMQLVSKSCRDSGSNSENHKKLDFHFEYEEIEAIYSSLMASQTDKSEKIQCRSAIIANLTHHHSSRRRLGGSRSKKPSKGNCYNACKTIKTAARIAFEYRLEDPVLEEVFRELYECNGSFAELFYTVLDKKEENNADVEYFLEQSTRMKLLFPVQTEMKPMLECPLNRMYATFRPIEGAIDNERFDDLKLMVRYGAVLDYETAFGDPISVAQMILDLVFKCYDPEKDQFYDKPKLPEYLGVLRVILRAVPRVTYPTPQQYRSESMFASDETVIENKVAMFNKLQRDGVISAGLAGKEPPLLQHLARLAIRGALFRAWTLPRGISKLALPSSLKEYLDLKTD